MTRLSKISPFGLLFKGPEAIFLVVWAPSMNDKVYALISMGLGHSQLVHRRVTQD
jgi:hypothetical protein